jgi:hypothetical protein
MGRIATLGRFEYEYEYDKTYEQNIGPKCSINGL